MADVANTGSKHVQGPLDSLLQCRCLAQRLQAMSLSLRILQVCCCCFLLLLFIVAVAVSVVAVAVAFAGAAVVAFFSSCLFCNEDDVGVELETF